MRSLQRRHLPVVFRALDLESKTKPVPCLVCPVRADLMTVGNCGRCTDFRRIEFDEDSRPMLHCVGGGGMAAAARDRVQDIVRVPVVCTAPDTTLAVILPYLQLGTGLDAIPVLDLEARPIGFMTVAEARRLVQAGIALDTTVEDVMSRQLVCLLPETSLSDAAEVLDATESGQLFAVAADGSFLGVVTMRDISAMTGDRRHA